MRFKSLLFAAVPLVLAGCPNTTTPDSAVEAVIGYSATTGLAPLTVVFSATGSTSQNAGALSYYWEFGDGDTSTSAEPRHTFAEPGRYEVRLRVTDAAEEQDTDGVTIRAQGTGATAVIEADRTSGTTPLSVQFDGTSSTAPDDEIFDYFWDFGDSTTSRSAAPLHVFQTAGTFAVLLRVETAGGVEASTETTITVGERSGSLQFDGASFATLPVASTPTSYENFTVEGWLKAENDGGTLFTFGASALSVEVQPGSNTLRLRVGSTQSEGTASNLADTWRHLAVAYELDDNTDPNDPNGSPGTGIAVLYLNGAPITSVPVTTGIQANLLTIGAGLRGKVGEVRFWNVARTSLQISTDYASKLTGAHEGLVGNWPCDDASGQTLRNRTGGLTGILGSSAAVESGDPAWSAESPPVD
jgi:PKD repeat protein